MNKPGKIVKLVLRNPGLAYAKAAITWRNKFSVKWDYYLKRGRARPPASIGIKLTNACNLACKMCGQQREGQAEGSVKYAPESFFRQKVEIDRYLALIDEVASFRPNIYLWGGEPFIYREIFQLIGHVKKRRMTCQINTNGLYIKKYCREIIASGLDDLIVSIDGPEKIHDQVRGLEGAFNLIKTGIRLLQEEKKRQGVSTPVIRLRGTISPENFEHIYSLTAIAKEFGADNLNFNWTWFTTRETGTAHQRLMKQLFNMDAQSWRPFETDVIMDPEKRRQFDGIREELVKLQNNREKFLITMSPAIKPEQVERYYTDIHETFGSDRCYSVWLKSYVLANGDVTPCPDYPDYLVGNILEQKFMEIWNGERYQKWRQELQKRKLFPVCHRCCDLFLSDVKVL
jgi:radical SAM protein with 4Fe4S-binding SPASM domain